MNHVWHHGKLRPTQPIVFRKDGFDGVLSDILSKPFDFYLSARGYHWVITTLYMSYWVFLLYYAYTRPIGGDLYMGHETALEVILWSCNAGFILQEMFELSDKGLREYFNLGVKGQTNSMLIQ